MKFTAFFLLVALLVGCNNGDEPVAAEEQKVTIATAANVQFAMQELELAFEEETGIEAEVSSASSGALTAQIKNGAPFDVYLAANMKYPNDLYQSGLTEKAPEVYAFGQLVLWTLKDLNLQQGIALLLTDTINRFAIANPDNAPYGIAAVEALKKKGIYEEVKDKIVYGESISQVNQYTSIQSVDVGLTSKSVVLSPRLESKGTWAEIDTELYTPIKQGVVILKHGAEHNSANAQKFYTFLFSEKAQTILMKYGYSVN